jgi:predicted dehydrogenase
MKNHFKARLSKTIKKIISNPSNPLNLCIITPANQLLDIHTNHNPMSTRRNFLKNSTLAGIGLSIPSALQTESEQIKAYAPVKKDKIRLGFIGVGLRGQSHLEEALKRKDIEVVAVADPDKLSAIPRTLDLLTKSLGATAAGRVKVFAEGESDYLNLLKINEIDAVIVATPWEWHARQGIDAMRAGKAVGMEVCGASDVQECWDLVHAHEDTKTPFFCLENVCYRRDVMAVLNMVRKGMFGEMLHLQGGYQHDLREVKFNDGKEFYGGGVEFGAKGISESKWRTTHSVYRNGDLYPTHGLGPVAMMLDINRGNRLVNLTSVATKARGLHNYVVEKGGKDHPNAQVEFRLGDIVTTSITTVNGETIILSHDTNSPRPYSLNFRVQGTKGLWMDDFNSLYIEGTSPKAHRWESADPYLEKHDHPLWTRYAKEAADAGHGGMDFFVLNSFIESLKRAVPSPLDVYDLATWYAITPLSEASIAQGGQVQAIPDFTRGGWMSRKPVFCLDGEF